MNKLILKTCFYLFLVILYNLFNSSAAFAQGLGLIVTAVKTLYDLATDSCPPPSTTTNHCVFCGMFKIIFNASSIIAEKSYTTFSSSLGSLVAIFLTVSIALIILKNLATMGSKEPGALLNEILVKAFICTCIFFIINNDYYSIINLTLTPIFEAGMEFVNSDTGEECAFTGGLYGYSSNLSGSSGGGLPLSIGKIIVCSVAEIESKINMLFQFGTWGFCLGFGPRKILLVIPNLFYIIDGIILYIAGIFFMATYPWVLGDAILQFGIAMALAPFAVAGYAFNGTKNYLPKVFEIILNSLFVFMFMAILMNVVLGYIESLFMAILENSDSNPKVFFTSANEGIAFFGPNMLKLIFILVIGWAYMPSISELAGQFAKGAALSAMSSIGGEIKKGVDKHAGQIGQMGLQSAQAGVSKSAALAGRGMTKLGRRTMTAAARGGYVGFLNKTFTTSTNARGDEILQKEEKLFFGRKKTTSYDKYLKITQTESAHGNTKQSKATFEADFIKNHLFEKNGNLNVEALQTVLDGPLAQDPKFREAIMTEVAVQALRMKGKDIGENFSSRNVVFDPTTNSISVVQQDHRGKATSFGLKVDMATGQIAMNYNKQTGTGNQVRGIRNKLRSRATNLLGKTTPTGGKTLSLPFIHWNMEYDASGNPILTKKTKNFITGKRKVKTYHGSIKTEKHYNRRGLLTSNVTTPEICGQYEDYFNNGHIELTTHGLKTSGDIADPNTKTVNEKTTVKYGEKYQRKYDAIYSDFDGNQVVESDGSLHPDVFAKRDEFLYGLDTFRGQTDFGPPGSTVSARTYIVENYLKTSRINKKNTFKTSYKWS